MSTTVSNNNNKPPYQQQQQPRTLITESRSSSKKLKIFNDSGSDLDADYRPIKIIIYRNGDKFDSGTEISVTRREFKQWSTFLDSLTKKIRSLKAIRKLYTLEGHEIDDFRYLLPGLSYVASGDSFRVMPYGEVRPLKWTPATKSVKRRDPLSIDSNESVQILMQKMKLDYTRTETTTSRSKFKTMTSSYDVTGRAGAGDTMSNPELGGGKTVSLPRIYVTQTTEDGKRRRYPKPRPPNVHRSNSAEPPATPGRQQSHAETQTPVEQYDVGLEQNHSSRRDADHVPANQKSKVVVGVPVNQNYDDRIMIEEDGFSIDETADLDFYYGTPSNHDASYSVAGSRKNIKALKEEFYG